MAESIPVNVQAFAPHKGGVGKRLLATTVTGSAAIPGMSGGAPVENGRVLVTNSGINNASVFVRLGNSDVTATLDSLEILPGAAYLLTPPFSGPGGVWIAAITETGTANISVMSGVGT